MLSGNCFKLLPRNLIKTLNSYASSNTAGKTDSLPASFLVEEGEEVEIDPNKFNKSGLLPQHRNIIHTEIPYDQPYSWIHLTEKYQRNLFGRYGTKSNVNPNICFGTKEDIAREAERQEQIDQHNSFQSMLENVSLKKKQELEAIKQREDDIAKKLSKLQQWKDDLNAKIAKREADALAAKEAKERLIEEVRRHFGFKVDPRDERFKEMLEQKEKEGKRKQKEAKRKAKEEKMMAKLVEKTTNM